MLREIGGRRSVSANPGVRDRGDRTQSRRVARRGRSRWWMPRPGPAPAPSSCRRSYAERLVRPRARRRRTSRASSLREFFAEFELDGDAHRAVVDARARRGLAVHDDAVLPRTSCRCSTSSASTPTRSRAATSRIDGLIAAAAATGRPLVISTGMSDAERSAPRPRARRAAGARSAGAPALRVGLSHAGGSGEPAGHLARSRDAFRVPVGLSDHGSGLRVGGRCRGARGHASTSAISCCPATPRCDRSRGVEHADAAQGDRAGDGAGARAHSATGAKRCQPAEAVERDGQPPRALRHAARCAPARCVTRGDVDRAAAGDWRGAVRARRARRRHARAATSTQASRSRVRAISRPGARRIVAAVTPHERSHHGGVAARAARPGLRSGACGRSASRDASIVTDVNPLSPAVHVADRAYRVPLADDPDYLDANS